MKVIVIFIKSELTFGVSLSDVLLGDFFEVLAPVLCESDVLSAVAVVLAHNALDGLLESLLEQDVVFIPRLDDGFVVGGVLHLHFTADLVEFGRFFCSWGTWFGVSILSLHLWPVGVKHGFVVDIEDAMTKSWPLSS